MFDLEGGERETLIGIEALLVDVHVLLLGAQEGTPPRPDEDAAREVAVEVEAILSAVGLPSAAFSCLPLLSDDLAALLSGLPCLGVHAIGPTQDAEPGTVGAGWRVTVRLNQDVLLARDPERRAWLATWEIHDYALPEEWRATARRLIQCFTTAYMEAHLSAPAAAGFPRTLGNMARFFERGGK